MPFSKQGQLDVRAWHRNRPRNSLAALRFWQRRWRSGIVRLVERLAAGRNPGDWQVTILSVIQHLPSAAESIVEMRVLEQPEIVPPVQTVLGEPSVQMSGVRRGVYAVEFRDVRAHLGAGLIRLSSGHVYSGSDGAVRYANLRGGAAQEDHDLSSRSVKWVKGRWTMAPGTSFFYHHLIDNCLPALKAQALHPDLIVGVPDKQEPWFYQTLDVLDLPYQVFSDRVVSFENFTYVDRAATNRADVEMLRERGVSGVGKADLVLLVSRQNYARYEQDVEDLLRTGLCDSDVIFVDPGSLPFREQVELFERAEIVIAPHGGANTNMIFAPNCIAFHEIFSAGFRGLEYAYLAQSCGIPYWSYDSNNLEVLVSRVQQQAEMHA